MNLSTSHYRHNNAGGGGSSSSSSSSMALFSSLFFIILLLLVGISLSISIGLGVFTLWLHPADPTMNNDHPSRQLYHPSSSMDQQQVGKKLVPINPHIAISDANYNSSKLLYYSNFSTVEQRRELEQMASLLEVPYYPPFATIQNGDQLAKLVLTGHQPPPLGGIVHILQQFLLELRNANKRHINVSNDKTGEDIVRTSYFHLAQQHLVPLDEQFRGQNVVPVKEEENTIFISLAAFREHLLYETLKGAFGRAEYPENLYVGVVMQNCFGLDDITGETYGCKTGAEVIGKDKRGRDMTRVSDKPPDINGVERFCLDIQFQHICQNGQLRVLSIHESESLGPAVARYYASKLWYGEKYFLQADSHLQFAKHWDTNYVNELQVTSNYPKSILSMYPPGFDNGDVDSNDGTPGTRLCTCVFSGSDVEDHIIRINNGVSYSYGVNYPRPTQIPFIAAGFFFARAEFLKDVPFDPFLPWCFMGEEIALSMRAWTNGWNIYAPRKNWIAHQYRPGRMGLPKFWGSVGRTFHRGLGFSNRLQDQVVNRIKHMVGYPETTKEWLKEKGIDHILIDLQYYGLGNVRSREEYTKLTLIDFEKKQCIRMAWCNKGELD
jgi:[Skp1-protein]-hydroxyproline N-acetylglucosaminyltransferase